MYLPVHKLSLFCTWRTWLYKGTQCERLDIPNGTFYGKHIRAIVVESGTTFTYLKAKLFFIMKKKVTEIANLTHNADFMNMSCFDEALLNIGKLSSKIPLCRFPDCFNFPPNALFSDEIVGNYICLMIWPTRGVSVMAYHAKRQYYRLWSCKAHGLLHIISALDPLLESLDVLQNVKHVSQRVIIKALSCMQDKLMFSIFYCNHMILTD